MIKITEETFYKLVMYFCLGQKSLHNDLQKDIGEKYNKVVNHLIYTQFKTAQSPEAREQFRQQYLDRVGIPEDFRWVETESYWENGRHITTRTDYRPDFNDDREDNT